MSSGLNGTPSRVVNRNGSPLAVFQSVCVMYPRSKAFDPNDSWRAIASHAHIAPKRTANARVVFRGSSQVHSVDRPQVDRLTETAGEIRGTSHRSKQR